MTAYLLQPHAKKGRKITPRQLLGRGFYARQAEETKEAAMKEFRRVQELKAAEQAEDE